MQSKQKQEMPTCWLREYAKKLRGRWQEICLICQQIGEDTQSAQTDSQLWLSVKPKLDEMQMDLRDKEQSLWIAGDPTRSRSRLKTWAQSGHAMPCRLIINCII